MARNGVTADPRARGRRRARSPVLLPAVATLLLAAAAFGLELASRTYFRPNAAIVNVRWTPTLDSTQRQVLERRFHLGQGQAHEGTSYVYHLTDISVANVRALVTHPDVLDTHHIDRSTFTLAPTAVSVRLEDPVAQQRAQYIRAAATVLWLAAAGAGALVVLIALPPVRARLSAAASSAARAIARTLTSGIPPASAEAAGLFRIVFCTALIISFAAQPVGSSSLPVAPLTGDVAWLTRIAGEVFIAVPRLAESIGPWLLVWGALSAAGAFTRLSFAAFTLGAVAWGLVISLQSSHHPFSPTLVAMVCLLPSRWGDGWSIDAWRRPRSGARVRSCEYGYSIWISGVVLGIALAAAAAAKLTEGGIAWALNGSVKYHILTDAEYAPVDWGVRFALAPGAAVALSIGGLAVESLVLPAALIGGPAIRALAAVATALLFAGFWVFHGVFWPLWWTLLLAFAPWHRVAGSVAQQRIREEDVGARRAVGLRPVQAAMLVLAIIQQVTASAWRLEVPPLVSSYDMYSKTYASPDDYVQQAVDSHWLTATLDDLSVSSCKVSEADARMVAARSSLWRDDATAGAVLARCFPDIAAVRTVAVEHARRQVDWAAGRYLGTKRVRVAGPAPILGDPPRRNVRNQP